MTLISPSLLASDFARLGQETLAMETAGADMLHIDIMDGHFVPNLSMGPAIIKALRGLTKLTFDVHLMITSPLTYIPDYHKAGADSITVHTEAENPMDALRLIKSLGLKTGICIKPATPAEELIPLLPLSDMVLIMTVEPGFGGQRFMHDMLPKIEKTRRLIDASGRDIRLEVDGGIDCATIPLAKKAGADVFVAGSALFGKPDYRAAINELRHAAG